jgi:Fe2+ transport protein
MSPTPALAALALPLALILSGCGGDGSDAERIASRVPAGVEEQYATLADEVAERGGKTTQGDWTVSYIVEAAEPWFEKHGSTTSFREPRKGETHHIEIIPTETATGRIVPDVPITLAVIDSSGEVVEEQKLNFYYSTFFHYANNFHVPKAGAFTLRATLGAPAFNRHGDKAGGPALAKGVTAEFEDVELTTE